MSLGVKIDFFFPSSTSVEEKGALFSEPHEIVACGILAGSNYVVTHAVHRLLHL